MEARVVADYHLGMADFHTMIQAQVSIDGASFFLSQGTDVDALSQQIEAAARSHATFIALPVVGNRSVRVLVSPRSHVVIAVETVPFDPRDTGDLSTPYGGFYDL